MTKRLQDLFRKSPFRPKSHFVLPRMEHMHNNIMNLLLHQVPYVCDVSRRVRNAETCLCDSTTSSFLQHVVRVNYSFYDFDKTFSRNTKRRYLIIFQLSRSANLLGSQKFHVIHIAM
ncbi:hypothetical protein O6H91_02G023400 [Diphasiastrum complanatum]|uniref:Uncharacterized protein n=1 Tax=Diphasiastrum complanatum TaxID=34168 RepID=A0ACC2EDK2_DIPCM|nr:hypothetical protein O6H91_02G023400 [Diphasiastrum complanatum]